MQHVGHMAVRTALQREEFDPGFSRAPVFAQFSSMGSLDAKWLHQEFQASLSAGRCRGSNNSGTRAANLHLCGRILITPRSHDRELERMASNMHQYFKELLSVLYKLILRKGISLLQSKAILPSSLI